MTTEDVTIERTEEVTEEVSYCDECGLDEDAEGRGDLLEYDRTKEMTSDPLHLHEKCRDQYFGDTKYAQSIAHTVKKQMNEQRFGGHATYSMLVYEQAGPIFHLFCATIFGAGLGAMLAVTAPPANVEHGFFGALLLTFIGFIYTAYMYREGKRNANTTEVYE